MNTRTWKWLYLVMCCLLLTYAMSQEDNKAVHLYNLATDQLKADHVTLTSAADDALRGFITNGLDQHPDADLDKSEAAIRTFADALARNAGEGATNSAQEGREKEADTNSFRAAKRGVCPLYPFC